MSSHFRCLGKNRDGTRCKKTFLTSKWSETLTCQLHKDQSVTFQYSHVQNSCPLHDVAYLIAKEISDPNTFATFAKLCLSTAKACHKLQDLKKRQFMRIVDEFHYKVQLLPNGTYFKINGSVEFKGKCSTVKGTHYYKEDQN